MRTILYSTEHVSANNWETALFILFLMFFAVAASAYVLYHGLQVSISLHSVCLAWLEKSASIVCVTSLIWLSSDMHWAT